MTFEELFRTAMTTESKPGSAVPYPYQVQFANDAELPALLNVPTGMGKTATAVLGWLYRRRFHCDQAVQKATPRRLVYCLPMRTLVEQTRDNAVLWLDRLQLLAGPDRVAVHVLMGGEDIEDWRSEPDRDAILIGTQDMLLSRSVNRGYAARRGQWATEFGLLLNDALWVFDEVQLMGNALATSVQLDAFGKKLWPPVVPNKFLWMSATLGPDMLRTRDREDWGLTTATELPLGDADLKPLDRRLNAPKQLRMTAKYKSPSAADVLSHHHEHGQGRISLVVLNTVSNAKAFYAELLVEMTPKPVKGKGKKKAATPPPVTQQPEVMLLHSRFRSMDRDERMTQLLAFLNRMDRETGAVADHPGLIVVSTQVIEAGFDLSSVALWSEVAPWASVIQRLGRLNREGRQPNATATFWNPKADDFNKGEGVPNAKRIGPYEKSSIDASRKLIEATIERQQAGESYRAALDATLATPESVAALKVEPEVVIRPQDFFELFSTEPDLAGGFTNIAPYVRSSDRDVDVHVFWRDFDPSKSRSWTQSSPLREELVAVPFFEFRKFLGKAFAYEWNFETHSWEQRREKDIQPGMTLLLPKSAGGYDRNSGWTGIASNRDFEVLPDRGDSGDDFDADRWSGFQGWLRLDQHLQDVEAEVKELANQCRLNEPLSDALSIAARWHDWGKSVSSWQKAVEKYVVASKEKLSGIIVDDKLVELHEVARDWLSLMEGTDVASQLWAKFPDPRGAVCDERLASLSPKQKVQFLKQVAAPFRPGLRHEAGSALAAWQAWRDGDASLSALAVYLIASHHGKVRTVLRSRSKRDEVFGLSAGDKLLPVPVVFEHEVELQTDCRHVGATGEWNADRTEFVIGSPSWIQMIAELLGPTPGGPPVTREVLSEKEPRALGPIALAYLEALLVAADVRASRTPGKGARS